MKNSQKLVEQFTACPYCRSVLIIKDGKIVCSNCQRNFQFISKDIPCLIKNNLSGDFSFSRGKWDRIFRGVFFQKESEKEYLNLYNDSTLRQLCEYSKETKNKVYLEIGCGQGFTGEQLAKRGWFFIGIDFAETPLIQLKKGLTERGITNFFLIQGDIKDLPIRNECIDLIYGGGGD